MCYNIFALLFYFPLIILWGNITINNQKIDLLTVMDNSEQEAVMHESSVTLEGTITKVTFGDLSKTNRVEKLVMYLYITTEELHEVLKFRKYPASESDKLFRVGQRVSVTAIKVKNEFDEFSEYSEIVRIEPLER